VDGPYSLTTTATSDTSFAGVVGGNTPLSNLTINTTSLEAGVIILAGGGGAASNLIVNGNFDTYDSTGWLWSGNTGSTWFNPGNAYLGPVGSIGTLSQSFSTVVGGSYTVSFSLANDGGTPSTFAAYFVPTNSVFNGINGGPTGCVGCSPLINQVNASGFNTTIESFTINAQSNSSTLLFAYQQNPAYYHLGNISVTSNAGILTINNSGAASITGAIGGSGTGLSKSGSGTLLLSGASTYSGGTTINAGIVQAGNDSFGVGGSIISGPLGLGTVVVSGGALDLNGRTVDNAMSISGGSSTIGALTNSSTTTPAVANGAISISSSSTIGGIGDLIISGPISSNSNGVAFVGAGSISAMNSSNTFSAISAGNLGAPIGSMSITNNGPLSIDSVVVGSNSYSGIYATGLVSIQTVSGDLSVNQAVSTSYAGSLSSNLALVLASGTSSSAGDSSGGNVILAGSPSISVGNGGLATLYTGSVIESAGVSALIGLGTGNFRYNSTQNTTNFTLAIGSSGFYAIYREQPTLTIAVDTPLSITYGAPRPTYSYSVNGVNGDNTSQALSIGATITDDGNISSSGHLTAGTHLLSGSGAVDQLGYALSYIGASLTVNQLALSGASIAGVNTTYGTPAAVGTLSFTNVQTGSGHSDIVSGSVSINNPTYSSSLNLNANSYTQTASTTLTGIDAGNYSFAGYTTPGPNYVVQKLALSGASIAGVNTTYGIIASTGIVTLTGVIPNDVLSANATIVNPVNSSSGNLNAGAYNQMVASANLNGIDASNYTLSTYITPSSNYNVHQRSLTVTADLGQTKIYGSSDPLLTYVAQAQTGIIGLLAGDSLSGALSRAIGENVGTYAITQGTLANANYNITFVGSSFAITPATLLLTPTPGQSKNYGQSDPSSFAYGLNGFINNSVVRDSASNVTVSGSLSRSPGENIGTYSYSSTLSTSNYNVVMTGSSSTFSILPAPLGIALTGTYSGATTISPTSFTVTGLAFGQTISSISSAVVNNANVSANGGNYVTAIIGVSGSAVLGNYYITAAYNAAPNTTTSNTATINPASLTIAAANDAKFVTQSDLAGSASNCGSGPCLGGYMGLTFNGFVNGEGVSVLSGLPSIVRNNASVNTAGVYSGVLQPRGYSSSNYNISYVNGDYVIAPANALLVKVNPSSAMYGSVPTYAASAAYLAADGSTIINLTPSITGVGVAVNDGVGGAASFNLSMVNSSGVAAKTSTSGNINVGGYNLAATNSSITGNDFKSLYVVGSVAVTPYVLNPNQLGITGVSKVYDGNINIGGLMLNTNPTLSRLLGSGSNQDQVSAIGSGTFDNPNVGFNKGVNISLSLAGVDGGNYVLSSNSFSANIGTITQLPSVNYIGPTGGNWSTQTNWAGGAIPTLNNVATVIIPAGLSVVYDASSVGQIGSIIQNNGTVIFNESSPFNLTNTLSGGGVFAQTGSAPLTISGNNNQSIPGPFTGQFSIASGSTLLLGNANALGAGNITSNNGSLGLTAGTILSSITVSGPVNLISNINTVGSQYYAGNVTISSGSSTMPMSISADDANITFVGTLNSDSENRSLTINAGLGKVSFTENVGGTGSDIYSLVVSAKNILLMADVTTLNMQTYNGAVVISDNGSNGMTRTFLSEDPSVIFGGTLDDSSAITHTLDVIAISHDPSLFPSVNFMGPVGSITPLGGLSVITEVIPAPSPANPTPISTPSGSITITGNITTVGGMSFNTNGINLQPAPGNIISLTSQHGAVQITGLADLELRNVYAGITIRDISSNASSPPNSLLTPDILGNQLDQGQQILASISVADPAEAILCNSLMDLDCK